MNDKLITLYKKLLFDLPSTTPSLKTYAIVDSMRDESVKERIPWSGLDYLDLWHEDLWEFELEVPLYLVKLEKNNEFTRYLLEQTESGLASYLISPYDIDTIQHYYSFFTHPECDRESFELYGHKEKAPNGFEWSRKVYFGAFGVDTLPDFIDTLYADEKIDEFFIGAAMWLIPNNWIQNGLYMAYRNTDGSIEDVNLDLTDLLDEPQAVLDFDNVSLPNIPDIEYYAHEIEMDLQQMKIFEERHRRRFVRNVFLWAEEEGYRFDMPYAHNHQKAFALFKEANTLNIVTELGVYRYIVYGLLVNSSVREAPLYRLLEEKKDEKSKIEVLTKAIWRILQDRRSSDDNA